MNRFITAGMVALGLCGIFAPAQAAEPGAETRPVDARVTRVTLDGAVSLRIRQGNPPTLTLTGNPQWLARITTAQSGDTLHIESSGNRMWGQFGHVELVLPTLRAVTSESLGSTEVSGFTGDELVLSLNGAGAMIVASSPRVLKADLGGIGSMRMQDLNCERVELTLQGAGQMALSGRANLLKADLGGIGSLDAQHFTADAVDLDLSGMGNASVTARQNASLNLSGMGSVTVYGKPANRRVEADGLGKVSWK